ncbi:hypothetical protein M0O54_07630 [Acinetobacter lactucae]|uniref:Lipoprotein n=1 Tax=Acinetobacter lactucae TaxID=1785128 RepID=A0AB35K555_9GAMM|nr:hypothetical protein [Acinetobacter lactucae]MDD9319995.1 hypothetical protein [Acinetobacter lactucae]
MNLKTILSVCAITLLSACSTPPKNENIQSVRLEPKPDFSGMSLVLSCDNSKNEASVLIKSPVVLEKEFRFTSDKNELNLVASPADDISSFSKENSKKILNLIYDANTLKITTSFKNNAEFDLAKHKTDIQNKIKACV